MSDRQSPSATPRAIPWLVNYEVLARQSAEPMRWLWHGYLIPGSITLLTSRWKAGKTTLISFLLSRMANGGILAGAMVTPGRAAVVSEEAPELWAQRGERIQFGPHLEFLCRPFRGKPSACEWEAMLDRLAEEHERNALNLIVIDPLASFLPCPDENNASAMIAALAPLQRLTSAGVAVFLVHHPRKLDAQPRGSGALPGFADILIEMGRLAPGDSDSRRRILLAASRFIETPAERRIELSADGTEYTMMDSPAVESFAGGWPILRMVLEDARYKLTRREVKSQWPEDHIAPGMTVLWEWLESAVAAGLVTRSGSGRRKDPFRYCLAGRENELRDDLFELEDLPPLEQNSWSRMAKFVLRESDRMRTKCDTITDVPGAWGGEEEDNVDSVVPGSGP